MPRPRKHHTGLPSYCQRDKMTGALWMYVPDESRKSGLRRQPYGSLDALLAAWRSTWGESKRRGERVVGDLLDACLAEFSERVKKGSLSPVTMTDYTRCHASLRPIWSDVLIEDVDVPMLYRWRDARGAVAQVRTNRERTFLFESFQLAVRRGTIKSNPVQYLERFTEKARTKYVTDAEFMAVFAVAPPVVRAAMLMAAVTGLRQGDILRIRRSDFSDAGLTVHTRKTGKTLVFGWTEGLRRAVLAAVESREFIPLMLIATETGRAYTGDGFRSLWHRAYTKAGIADAFTFNDLRAKAGSDSRDWRLLGHLDQRTFERVYNRLPRHVTPSR
jgi:integrase